MQTVWKGAISFGLLNVPVKMGVATQHEDISFKNLHKKILKDWFWFASYQGFCVSPVQRYHRNCYPTRPMSVPHATAFCNARRAKEPQLQV